MLKSLFRWLLTLLYQVEVRGIDHFAAAGKRVLIVANHISFLDPLLLGVFLPGRVTFAINTQIAQRWWVKPFLQFARVFEMDPTNPLSLKTLIHHLREDNKTVIFPEGRITVTGSLMKIYDGPGMVADKADATILPVRINGAEYTYFSKLRNLVRLRWFPKITIDILPPTRLALPAALKGKERRKQSGQVLADLMTEMMFTTSHYRQTIFARLLEARKIHGGKHLVAEDLERHPLTYDALITRVLIVGDWLERYGASGENIGVLLPNSVMTLLVILALQRRGRVPAMLNFSVGSAALLAACRLAEVRYVVTSRRFIDKAKLHDTVAQLMQRGVHVIEMEAIAHPLSMPQKLRAWWRARTVGYWYRHDQYSPDSPAVVLFTSGSEGTPKGVVLSHANILANHQQLGARVSFNAQDIVLNVLPMFHSFGFTTGSLFPVLNGMRVFFYPTPLHYSVIPEIAYEINATVLFGTNTFLAGYAKKAHAYDFYSLRYVFAGAEKLHDATRQTWADKFGIRILEGYGATETSPVLAVNTPMEYQAGSVGRLLPGITPRIESVPGIAEGGKLHVTGPNIMQGYLKIDAPGVLQPPTSCYGAGWYDTGDIVTLDERGYLRIIGRSKRFAKISGEMVSLAVPEQLASQLWPSALHAVVALPDRRKGEQLVLITTAPNATLAALTTQASATGLGMLHVPRKLHLVAHMPLLATGKIDYPAVTALASALLDDGADHTDDDADEDHP